MKEKVIGFIKNEEVKRSFKKVVNKKTLGAIIVIFVLASAAKLSFSLLFEIEGTVKSIDGKNITVVNFFTTKTVDVGDFPIETKQIQVGDKIEIRKNLSGDIISVRDGDKGRKDIKSNIRDNGKEKSKENDKNEHRAKN